MAAPGDEIEALAGVLGRVTYPGAPGARTPQVFVEPSARYLRHGLEAIVLSQPAAGANFTTYKIPPRVSFDLYLVFGSLTTSVAVATRQPQLQLLTPNGNVAWRGTSVAGQPASLGKDHIWARLLGASENNAGATADNSLPDLPPLPPGWQISFQTAAIDVADQWASGLICGVFTPLDEGVQ